MASNLVSYLQTVQHRAKVLSNRKENYFSVNLDPGESGRMYYVLRKATEKLVDILNRYEFSGPEVRAERRTQKAQSIASQGFRAAAGLEVSVENKVWPYYVPDDDAFKDGKSLFVRPAPMRPRHGFVESREVKSWQEFHDILTETLTQDPDGELIFMEKLTGLFSAVATNAGIAWAKGSDGVTSGTSKSFFIPAASPVENWKDLVLSYELSKTERDDLIKGTAYLELVQHEKNAVYPKSTRGKGKQESVVVVQRRDGPEVAATLDYIPNAVTNAQVITSEGFHDRDGLLRWEGYIERLKNNEDNAPHIVINLPDESLASHYAVHAIQHGLPVVTTRKVKDGEDLEPLTNAIPELEHKHYRNIARYMKAWMNRDFIDENSPPQSERILSSVFATLHAQSQWGGEKHLLNLRGMAYPALVRYLLAASVGELRHWWHSGPGFNTTGSPPAKTNVHFARKKGPQPQRSSVYVNFLLPRYVDKHERILKDLVEDFSTKGWNSAYGGARWGQVAEHTLYLVQAIKAFVKEPNKKTWTEVVLKGNIAVHTAHNGGIALNKWISQTYLDQISQNPAIGFANPFTARIVLGYKALGPFPGDIWHAYKAGEYLEDTDAERNGYDRRENIVETEDVSRPVGRVVKTKTKVKKVFTDIGVPPPPQPEWEVIAPTPPQPKSEQLGVYIESAPDGVEVHSMTSFGEYIIAAHKKGL